MLNIALFQTELFWADAEANREKFTALFDQVKEKARVYLLPEMFSTGFCTDPKDIAETMNGQTHEWMKAQAAKHNAAIAGSIVIRENGKYLNRFLWVNPDGKTFTYDKKHLFSLGEENLDYSSGIENITIEFEGWRIRPMVCYDLRFPVWTRNVYKNGMFEYDLLLYVANWPAARAYQWRQMLISRAIENQSYVAAVNRVGSDENGWEFNGQSLAVDPLGEYIVKPDDKTDRIAIASLDLEKLKHYRNRFPVGRDWDGFEVR
ncbi:MAG: amidohydrolase [Bacteroidales bacterium]|nr:amidohydrolase [Bacteroidales bacterium]